MVSRGREVFVTMATVFTLLLGTDLVETETVDSFLFNVYARIIVEYEEEKVLTWKEDVI